MPLCLPLLSKSVVLYFDICIAYARQSTDRLQRILCEKNEQQTVLKFNLIVSKVFDNNILLTSI